MATIYCEGQDEFSDFDEGEFRDFGGVRVHAVGAWHLTNGAVVDMVRKGVPRLEDGRPVVTLEPLSPAERKVTVAEFDVAPEAGPDQGAP